MIRFRSAFTFVFLLWALVQCPQVCALQNHSTRTKHMRSAHKPTDTVKKTATRKPHRSTKRPQLHGRLAGPRAAPNRLSLGAHAASLRNVTLTLSNTPEGVIEQPEALVPFFAQLAALESNPTQTVHILHFGDSHTAADMFTGELRTLFQQKFGDGGAGFSFAGYPFAGYRIGGTHRDETSGWSTVGTHFRDLPDPMLGLGGIGINATETGERTSLDAESNYAELQYLQQPQGGNILVFVDDALVQTMSTDGPLGSGYLPIETVGGRHHLQVQTADDAPVRLLGWVTQNKSGVTYEAIGINGAEASLILRWNEDMQNSYLRRREPALVVLEYGTNEASNSNWTGESYREMFTSVIERIRRGAPHAAILVIGPGDRYIRGKRQAWMPFAGIDRIVAAQRDTCREHGCAFWDQRERMGGSGSMRDWVSAQWAQPDHTHFTVSGYQTLAKTFYSDLMREYSEFKRLRAQK